MTETIYISSVQTDLREYIAKPVRTKGCILMVCVSGYAVVECNFTRKPFRKGMMGVIFSDSLFSVEKVSRNFSIRMFELSVALTDDATFISSGPFFDWLSENPVFLIPEERRKEVGLWLEGMEWIEDNADSGYRKVMLRNQWQNLFLGLESAAKPLLETKEMKTISSSRRLFNKFCQLIGEHCRTRHNVKFYADRLCITPYYLSKVTDRIFNVSPKELIDRQLIMEIKAVLTTTDLSVKEISDRFCFESASYLGRYFRRHTGMTPLDFRERQTES